MQDGMHPMFPPGVLQAGLAGDAVGDEGAVLCEPGREGVTENVSNADD